jgi:hypothetical protein
VSFVTSNFSLLYPLILVPSYHQFMPTSGLDACAHFQNVNRTQHCRYVAICGSFYHFIAIAFVCLYMICRILLARLEYLRETFQIKEGDFLTFDALVIALFLSVPRAPFDWHLLFFLFL